VTQPLEEGGWGFDWADARKKGRGNREVKISFWRRFLIFSEKVEEVGKF
jgi:hypothetical protein